MTGESEAQSSRSYHSPRRLAAARATRARIRGAARDRFVADGYAATSVRSIAVAAGVAEKTVYLQFPTKLDLLKEVVETAIVGDDEAVAAADREWFRQIVDDPEPTAKVRRLVEATSALHERTGEVFAMARGAAASDPDAATLWAFGKAGHRADMGLLATSFEKVGMLPPAGTPHGPPPCSTCSSAPRPGTSYEWSSNTVPRTTANGSGRPSPTAST